MSTIVEIEEQLAERPDVSLLRQKITWLCQLIRWMMTAFVLWALYANLQPLIINGASKSAIEWNAYWGLALGTVTETKVYMNRAIFLVSWAAAALLGWAIWKLMSGYLAGEILSAEAAQRLRLVGIIGFASAVIDIVVRPIALGVLSMDIVKQTPLLDWVEPRDLLYFCIALFVLSLGHIQGTAARINDEHRQIV
jgi:hypothetical protein